MDYDLYTNDDRRYGRVIQQDDGDSVSGSSYAGSDASHTSRHFPEHYSSTRDVKHLSQPVPVAEPAATCEGSSGINATGFGACTDPSSGINHKTTRGQEDQLPGMGRRTSSGTVWDGDRATDGSTQAESLPSQSREDVVDALSVASGSSRSGLEANTLSRNDGRISMSERDVTNGQGLEVGFSSRTTLSAGSNRFRSPPLGLTGETVDRTNREFRDIVLPRWQPDAEVTYCPICRTQFSFFVRKHHCRRCGRVVCNACSPHRITIPYQFIVQPPPTASTQLPVSASRSMNNSDTPTPSDIADRNGGMKVRLCNPCVPDPNPLPPQPQYSDTTGLVPTLYLNSRSRPYSFTGESISVSSSGRARGLSAASGLRPDDRRPQYRSSSPRNRHIGSTGLNSGSSSMYPNIQSGVYPGHLQGAEPLRADGSSLSTGRSSHSQSPARSSQDRGHASRHQSLSFISGGSTSNPQPHYRSLLDIGNDPYPRTSASGNRPLPPVPYVNEEDECPVCHRVLFSHSLPDFENRRAAHIMQCIDEQIALHSGNSSRPEAYAPQPQPLQTSSTPDQSTPSHESTALPTSFRSPIANTPEARTAARERAHAAVVLGTSARSTPPGRRTGMFIYRASEKDCVDDAECTICLEEFEVGASMARLECFCRFHRKCIQDWFVDHPGRCPVHQHDGYGF